MKVQRPTLDPSTDSDLTEISMNYVFQIFGWSHSQTQFSLLNSNSVISKYKDTDLLSWLCLSIVLKIGNLGTRTVEGLKETRKLERGTCHHNKRKS